MTGRNERELLRSLRRADGWFTVGLVVLICATLAWSLDDALLVLGRDQYTDFLFWAAIGGVAAGFIGPLVGWGRWTTHLLGAVFAGLVVPLLVGWTLIPTGGPPGVLFQRTTDSVVQAWSDLVLAGRLSTIEFGHHLYVLGMLTWATSQFATFAAFGHRRPINAVVVVGSLLLANMALTVREQMTFLVIFSIASLFLLVRFHTLDEQSDWLRRRIGDPTAISALYLRGGTVFIIAAITGSLVLTNAASSAPLAGAWTDVGARVIEWGQFLERFLPASRSSRSLGPTFGDSTLVGLTWNTTDQLQLSVAYPAEEQYPPFLAAAYYDQFRLAGWVRGEQTEQSREAGAEVLAGTAEQVTPAGRRSLVATITPAYARREIFAPGFPSKISQVAKLRLLPGGYLAGIEREPTSEPYTVTTLVGADEKSGGWTEERLRAAGTNYPPEIVALYGRDTLPDGSLGPQSRALLAEIFKNAQSHNPYDLAIEIRDTLRDTAQFEYDTDLSDKPCVDTSIVECFVVGRAGFCQYYASTMTVFLRELGIPARYVEGFLPGEPDAAGGGRTVRAQDAHAWVQAYFPGYGWIDFDPTGGPERPQLAPIPSGAPVASGSPGPSGSGSGGPAIPTVRGEIDQGPGGPVSPRAGDRTPVGLFIAITMLLAVVVGSLAAVAWRRGPRGTLSADDAYGSVSRLASRLGFGPRPTQTVYEYAGALADELPMVRPELETVARAKVEVAYGARSLADERLAALRHAHRRLRVQLLRLLMRRRRRPGRWRG